MIDFTDCKRLPGRAYNGANGKKIAIQYEGEVYMLKFPSSGADKPTELSYTNSCISEHIASTIFNMLKNTILDSESGGNGTELDDILETIEKQKFVRPERLLEHFWEMFVVDALLGNFDRHNGNWGFLYESKTGESEIAPIYDCGSCLLPQADEKVMHDVLGQKGVL